MSKENKTVIRRLFEELWNKGNLSVADQLFAPNYTHHDPSTPDVGLGPESEKKRATLYRTAFPDLRLTIEDIFAEGETLCSSSASSLSSPKPRPPLRSLRPRTTFKSGSRDLTGVIWSRMGCVFAR